MLQALVLAFLVPLRHSQSEPRVEFPSLALTFSPIAGGIIRVAPSSEVSQPAWFVDETAIPPSSAPPPAWRLVFLSGHSLDSSQCAGAPSFDQHAPGNITIGWRFVPPIFTGTLCTCDTIARDRLSKSNSQNRTLVMLALSSHTRAWVRVGTLSHIRLLLPVMSLSLSLSF